MFDRPDVPTKTDASWMFVSREDRAALLGHGIVVLADGIQRRKRWVLLAARDRDAAQTRARAVFGPRVDVTVHAEGPRRLEPLICDGYMEREPGRLQLRYATTRSQHLDDVLVEETDLVVVVYATVCTPTYNGEPEVTEGPVHVYLAAPLGDRLVIDGVTGRAVPFKDVYAELAEEFGLEVGGCDEEVDPFDDGPTGYPPRDTP